MAEINPELVIYRLDKMEKMMSEHNLVHEQHMKDILAKLGAQYSKTEIDAQMKGKAASWVEGAMKGGITTVITAVILAVLGLVFAPNVFAGWLALYHLVTV